MVLWSKNGQFGAQRIGQLLELYEILIRFVIESDEIIILLGLTILWEIPHFRDLKVGQQLDLDEKPLFC